jgi:ATP-dependent helicase/nuclease subunit A
MQWTESQREAIETRNRRVIVTAGAGSGKTRVLVERFLKLLEENPSWRVSDIVAVTFTEKAAREMVSRIRREIRSRISQSGSQQERETWRAHRNALDSARIGTIHALCASILRAHPAEARLDPAFEVMEEMEVARLIRQAIEEAIDEAARESNQPTFSSRLNPIEMFAYISPRDAQSALTTLIAQGERARRAIERVENKSPDEIIALWQQTLDHLRAAAARSVIESDSWTADAETIVRLAALDCSDKREQCRAQVAALLVRISSIANESPEGIASDSQEGIADDLPEGDRIARALLEIESSIDLRGGSKKKWPSEDAFSAVKLALSRMRESVRSERLFALELNAADKAAAIVAAGLSELYKRSRERFTALKRERAAVDFNDLEELTETMLAAHAEVAERYADARNGLIRALMVDEFQDTAPIQKNILWMIAPRTDEVFIIGDAKQSIYRFRGADVTVFHDTRRELKLNGGRETLMDACFRAHDRLVGFVNHLFPSIFTCESRYDTPYEAMSASRQAAHSSPAVEIHVIADSKESGNKLNVAQLRQAEAQFIARRIRQIVERGEIPVCEKEDQTRGAEYGDFALLFQASTSFDIYEQALADASIPYVTIAGRGFYDRQEITDITSLLAFLVSSNDSLRLAAALRSPLFALSDETLLRLRLGRERVTLWKSLLDESVEHAESEREAVRFARETLKRLKAIAGRVSAAETITAALAETGYLATLASLPHGERRMANVEKFIEQARALTGLTLAELVERTADLKFREAREGEATIEEAGAVRIMTIHKSKGLEFPIVWIADATYAGGRDRSIIAAHADHGVAISVSADRIETDDERMRAASFEMLRRIEERMDAAEKKRLLYVAATRAREHLLISGAPGRANPLGDHWLGRILAALGIDEAAPRSEIRYPGGEAIVGWHDQEEIISEQGARRVEASQRGDDFDERRERASAGESVEEIFPLLGPLAEKKVCERPATEPRR